MKKVVGLAAIALLSTPLVWAQTQSPANELDENTIIRNLENAGYTEVHDIEKDDGGMYEAEATNSVGQRVEVHIDPISGSVVREEPDDDDKDDGMTASEEP